MYTKQQAEEAIQARKDGVWDNPQLVRLGPLMTIDEDIQRINKLIW